MNSKTIVRVWISPVKWNLWIWALRSHIYNISTALHQILKDKEAEIIFRCDDTNNKKIDYKILNELTEILKQHFWINIDSKDFIKQSERYHIYEGHLKKLIEKWFILDDTEWCKSFNIKKYIEIFWERIEINDILLWNISFDLNNITNIDKGTRIQRSDGNFLYNFASVIDDSEFGTTHITRWKDKISTIPFQEMFRNTLDFSSKLNYIHLPLLLTDKGKENGWFHGNEQYKIFLKAGIIPEAINSYIFSSGYGSPEEIYMNPQEFYTQFNIKKIHKSSANFDFNKILNNNKKILQKITDDKYLYHLKTYLHINQENELLQALNDKNIEKLAISLKKNLPGTKIVLDDILNPKHNLDELTKDHKCCIKFLLQTKIPLNYNHLDEIIKKIWLEKRIVIETIRRIITWKTNGPCVNLLLNHLCIDWATQKIEKIYSHLLWER